MDYKLTKLGNGIKILTVELPQLNSATLTVWLTVGSRFENDKISGLSHFLEHMSFKGSKKRPNAQLVSQAIDELGAENNAGTSREWTNFYIKTRTARLDTAFDIISDILLNPVLSDIDIERERGVILEEIAMSEDVPVEKVGDIFMQLIFPDSSLGRDISGTEKSIKNITKNDFLRHRKRHYVSENMLISVAGGVGQGEALKMSDKYFSSFPKGKKEIASKFIPNQKKPQLKVHYKKTEQGHFILGFLSYNRNHPKRYAESILATILGRGMSSRLFNEIRWERGLAYAVSTSVSRFVDTGVFANYAGVKTNRVDEAIEIILDQSYGLAEGKFPISRRELVKAKEYLKGRTALALEDTTSVNEFFGERALFSSNVESLDEVFKAIDRVDNDEVVEVAKELFVPERLNVAIIGPYKNISKFEKIIK